MLDQARPNWRIESDKQRRMLGAIINKDRRTWTQLTNYYDTGPRNLMTRIESIHTKLSDGRDYADENDDISRDDVSDSEWQEYVLATQYRIIMDDVVGEMYADLVSEYTEIYGDE
jgi:hypothetical protein